MLSSGLILPWDIISGFPHTSSVFHCGGRQTVEIRRDRKQKSPQRLSYLHLCIFQSVERSSWTSYSSHTFMSEKQYSKKVTKKNKQHNHIFSCLYPVVKLKGYFVLSVLLECSPFILLLLYLHISPFKLCRCDVITDILHISFWLETVKIRLQCLV